MPFCSIYKTTKKQHIKILGTKIIEICIVNETEELIKENIFLGGNIPLGNIIKGPFTKYLYLSIFLYRALGLTLYIALVIYLSIFLSHYLSIFLTIILSIYLLKPFYKTALEE